MDMLFGIGIIMILIPVNIILIKLVKGVYDSFGVILLLMGLNAFIIGVYMFGLYDDITSLLKFGLGLGLAVILNMVVKIFIVHQELSQKI